jgi:hypothetical protein
MSTGRKIGYRKVPVDGFREVREDEFLCKSATSEFRGSQRAHRYFIIAILLCIFGLAAIAIVRDFSKWQTSDQPRNLDWTPCGNTSTEARANHCHFDLILNAWVPEACYITEPADEYDISEWNWFLDRELTQPTNATWFKTGNWLEMFTAGNHHIQHCIYSWRQLSIAVERRLPLLDSKVANFHHSTHCAKRVREVVRDSLNTVDTFGMGSVARMQFHDCVPFFT